MWWVSGWAGELRYSTVPVPVQVYLLTCIISTMYNTISYREGRGGEWSSRCIGDSCMLLVKYVDSFMCKASKWLAWTTTTTTTHSARTHGGAGR